MGQQIPSTGHPQTLTPNQVLSPDSSWLAFLVEASRVPDPVLPAGAGEHGPDLDLLDQLIARDLALGFAPGDQDVAERAEAPAGIGEDVERCHALINDERPLAL
jgi:hypothetical protein